MSRSGGALAAGNVLSTTPWLWLATWVLQVMPVVFVVGGFANMVSWQALRRRGGGYVEYLSGRMGRLLRPVLAFTAVWLVLPPVLARLGWPAAQVELVGQVMGQPLWFLGVYLVVVWTLAQQAGFFYADGTLTRLSRRALAGLGAAGLAGLIVLTGPGGYPPSMVGLPGDASNMSPPTLCITAMVALYGPVVAVDGPLPAPGTGWWWASRPLLGLRVDPLQNLAHLLVGAYLARAARTGATSRPHPWLLTAAGSALPLAAP